MSNATLKFDVEIPNWIDGKSLTIRGINGANEDAARAAAVEWVNKYAGYEYCTELPIGTKVFRNTD